MITFVVFYIIICVILVLLILLQQNQGGGLGILGGSSDSVLGTSQNTVLSVVIRFMAILFVVGAIFLSIMSSGEVSLLDKKPTPKTTEQTPSPTSPPAENQIPTLLDEEDESKKYSKKKAK